MEDFIANLERTTKTMMQDAKEANASIRRGMKNIEAADKGFKDIMKELEDDKKS